MTETRDPQPPPDHTRPLVWTGSTRPAAPPSSSSSPTTPSSSPPPRAWATPRGPRSTRPSASCGCRCSSSSPASSPSAPSSGPGRTCCAAGWATTCGSTCCGPPPPSSPSPLPYARDDLPTGVRGWLDDTVLLPGNGAWYLLALALYLPAGRLLRAVPTAVLLPAAAVLAAAFGPGQLVRHSFVWSDVLTLFVFFVAGLRLRDLALRSSASVPGPTLVAVGAGATGALALAVTGLGLTQVPGVRLLVGAAAVVAGCAVAVRLAPTRTGAPWPTSAAARCPSTSPTRSSWASSSWPSPPPPAPPWPPAVAGRPRAARRRGARGLPAPADAADPGAVAPARAVGRTPATPVRPTAERVGV